MPIALLVDGWAQSLVYHYHARSCLDVPISLRCFVTSFSNSAHTLRLHVPQSDLFRMSFGVWSKPRSTIENDKPWYVQCSVVHFASSVVSVCSGDKNTLRRIRLCVCRFGPFGAYDWSRWQITGGETHPSTPIYSSHPGGSGPYHFFRPYTTVTFVLPIFNTNTMSAMV